jgi:hypothetical protein
MVKGAKPLRLLGFWVMNEMVCDGLKLVCA